MPLSFHGIRLKPQKRDKSFLIYLGSSVLLYILPIILADFPYRDDLSRNIEGAEALNWIRDGRLVTQFLFFVMSGFGDPLNLSPLYQIFAGIFLTLSGFMIYKKFYPNLPPIFASLITFSIICHIFMLEPLSYQYDAMSITLAMLLAIISFYLSCFCSKKASISSFIILVLALLTYNVVISIFIGLAIVFYVKESFSYRDPKLIITNTCKRAIIAVCSYILFYILSSPFYTQWAKSRNNFIFTSPTGYQDFENTWAPALHVILKVVQGKELFLCLFLLFIIGLSLLWIYQSWRVSILKNSNFYSWVNFFVLCFTPFILFINAFSSFLFLSRPIFAFRILISLLSILLFIMLGLLYITKKKFRYLRYIVVVPALFFMITSYNYSNLQKNQQKFEHHLINYIVEDLKNLNAINDVHNFIFVGEERLAPEIEQTINRMPIFLLVVPKYFVSRMSAWAKIYLKYYPILDIKSIYREQSQEAQTILKFSKNQKPSKEKTHCIV